MQWSHLIAFFCAFSVVQGAIFFRKYCLNDTDPDVIPSEGKFSSGILKMNDEVTSYDPGLNCSVAVRTETNFHLLVSFLLVSLRNSSLDTLTIFYNNNTQTAVLSGQTKCANGSCVGLMFDSGPHSENLDIHFTTANITVAGEYHGFKALYTSYNMVNKDGKCEGTNRFLCLNGHCIAKELVCDGDNNCGDSSDETGCHIPSINTIWGVVVIVLAVASVAIFVPAFCFMAVKGTLNVINVVTVPNEATPLYSAINNDEAAHLTSSIDRSASCYWGSSSCSLDRRHSYSSGVVIKHANQPSTSQIPEFPGSYHGERGMHIPS